MLRNPKLPKIKNDLSKNKEKQKTIDKKMKIK